MMKHKKIFILLACTVLIIMSCLNLKDIAIGNPDLSNVADGTYRGKSRVGPVRVTLDVTIRSGAIKSIDLIQHFNGLGKKAESIIPQVIEKQTLEVDVVSGATGSSKAILKAIETALQ
jgi:uncharacterized protein with FMN-binding domain